MQKFLNKIYEDNSTNNLEKELIYRNEYKYLLSADMQSRCYDIFRSFMQTDVHADSLGQYNVSSLYFDSINNVDFNDKTLGNFERKKIRIRFYPPDINSACLEVKHKIGDLGYKEKVKLTQKEISAFTEGDFSCLLKKGTDTALRLYVTLSERLYRPVCIVNYTRTAFVLPVQDLRITIDSKIEYTNSSYDLFEPNVLTPIYPDGHSVLEIKFNKTLPGFVKMIIKELKMTRESISKYCLSRDAFLF